MHRRMMDEVAPVDVAAALELFAGVDPEVMAAQELTAQVAALVMETFERNGWPVDRVLENDQEYEVAVQQVMSAVEEQSGAVTAAELKAAFQQGWQESSGGSFPGGEALAAWVRTGAEGKRTMDLNG